MKSALLVIDMCNDFFKDGALFEKRADLVNSVNALVHRAHNSNIPIIWIRQEFEPDLSDAFLSMRKTNHSITIKGTGGEEILTELNKKNTDYEIIKKRYSGFFNTGLDNLLRELGIKTLIFSGINTHACIRTTAIDAYQRDYEVVIAKEAVASYDRIHHDITLEYLSKSIARVLPVSQIVLT